MKTKAKGQTEYTKREQEHVDASRRIDAELYGDSEEEIRAVIRESFKTTPEPETAKAK